MSKEYNYILLNLLIDRINFLVVTRHFRIKMAFLLLFTYRFYIKKVLHLKCLLWICGFAARSNNLFNEHLCNASKVMEQAKLLNTEYFVSWNNIIAHLQCASVFILMTSPPTNDFWTNCFCVAVLINGLLGRLDILGFEHWYKIGLL